MKLNVESIVNALEIVSKLQGRTYYWRPEFVNSGETRVIGLIAQEVQQVLPEVSYWKFS